MLDNVVLMLWPTINPDGQQMVAEWYMKNVGTPYELSGLPRLYQEYVGHDNNRDAYMLNMIESRVHRAHVAAVGAADHLRAPPVGPVSDAHLAAAVLRAGRHRRAVRHVARSEHDRHGDREGARGARAGRRDAHGHGVRRLVSRATSTTRRTSRTSPRSGPRPRSTSTRRRTTTRSTTSRRTCATCGRRACIRARGRRAGGGCATRSTTWRRRRCRCSSTRRSTRSRCCSNRYRAGRDQIALGAKKAPYAYFVPQEQRDPVAAVELLRRLAFGGVRVSQLTAPATIDGDDVPGRHVGRFRPIRNSRRWRARCSTCRSIRICGSIPAVRRSVRTTPPAGRCRCRWA